MPIINIEIFQSNPYTRAHITRLDHHPRDGYGNIMLNSFSEIDVNAYISFLQTGVINCPYNHEIFDYMNHDYVDTYIEDPEFLSIMLMEQWLKYCKDTLGTIDTYMSSISSSRRGNDLKIDIILSRWNVVYIRNAINVHVLVKTDNLIPLITEIEDIYMLYIISGMNIM